LRLRRLSTVRVRASEHLQTLEMGGGPSRPLPQPIRGPGAPQFTIVQEAPPPPGHMRVVCPPQSGPGHMVLINDPATGQQMQVTVPHGVGPGGHFDVLMPAPAGGAPMQGAVVQGYVVGGQPVAVGGPAYGQQQVIQGQVVGSPY